MKKKTLGVVAGLMAVLLAVAGSVKLYDYLNPKEDETDELTLNVIYIENLFTFTEIEFFDNPTFNNIFGGMSFYYNTINGYKIGYSTYDAVGPLGELYYFAPFKVGPINDFGFVVDSLLISKINVLKINGEIVDFSLKYLDLYSPVYNVFSVSNNFNPFIDDFNDVISIYSLNYISIKVNDIKLDDIGSYIIKDENKYYLY